MEINYRRCVCVWKDCLYVNSIFFKKWPKNPGGGKNKQTNKQRKTRKFISVEKKKREERRDRRMIDSFPPNNFRITFRCIYIFSCNQMPQPLYYICIYMYFCQFFFFLFYLFIFRLCLKGKKSWKGRKTHLGSMPQLTCCGAPADDDAPDVCACDGGQFRLQRRGTIFV